MTPKELRERILSYRMQPDKARDVLLKLRGHIDGMLAAEGDESKIIWHHKRLAAIIHGPHHNVDGLAHIALIASKEKDWFVAVEEESRRAHEAMIAEQRKGRTQCEKCLPLAHGSAPWVLPDEKCPGCEFRRARDEWKATGVWPKDVPV